MEYNNEAIMKKKQKYGLSISFGEEEEKMVNELKLRPHYINMSELLRTFIRSYYESVKNRTRTK